jgi:diguanylate cyclase (GGDEF)-like protein
LGSGRKGETPESGRLPWPCDLAPLQGSETIALTHELADGRMIEIAYQPVDGGGWVAIHEDVTAKHQQDVRIERLAHCDSVTGIANRHSFQDRLGRAFRETGTTGSFAVHWIDLDRFKAVNDTFGHPVGDALLEQVAERLVATVRTEDFVARLGGDEFAVIQLSATEDTATPLAQRLIRQLSAPYTILGHRIEIGASAGLVMAPSGGTTPEDLIRNADIALYQAKANGRGCGVMFEASLAAAIKERRALEADLLEALDRGDFEMHYQPILDLATGEVAVCEALMRWTHPVRGPVSPAIFIPLAEEIGAINALGAFALSRACTNAADWPVGIKVAVNLSAEQFEDEDFVGTVMRVLSATGLPANRLELEITETVLMRDDAKTIEILDRLRTMGITIALDDFGTGFSSLSYLRRFPFDKIKIDQSFIRDLPSRTESVAIVRAVAQLAKTLGMRTVAEGVETASHFDRVVLAGCDQVQGYLISRPVPNAALQASIAAARKMAAAVAA